MRIERYKIIIFLISILAGVLWIPYSIYYSYIFQFFDYSEDVVLMLDLMGIIFLPGTVSPVALTIFTHFLDIPFEEILDRRGDNYLIPDITIAIIESYFLIGGYMISLYGVYWLYRFVKKVNKKHHA